MWGSELVAPHYSAAWAWAGNCPFQWGKQVASHLGGTRQGMAIRYPRLITDAGGLRSQFTHCIDIGPTILELAGIPQPTHVEGIAQTPMHGTSFLHTFADPAAEERHTQQYFEIYGYRAMYKDGWWLAQQIDRIPWDLTPATIRSSRPAYGSPTTTGPSCTTCPMTSPRRTTSLTGIRRRSGNCGSCSGPKQRNTRSCRCWPG